PTSSIIFLVTRPPPRSPLFPYTTLFRSQPQRAGHRLTVGQERRPADLAGRQLHVVLLDVVVADVVGEPTELRDVLPEQHRVVVLDRKSTRLNSSHVKISYAVFCLKKKRK